MPYADPRLSATINIAAFPLSNTAGAISSPINSISALSGKMLLNSNLPLSVAGGPGTYDLYTVSLHEVGVLLGLPLNNTPSSVMYTQYNGARTGISSGDIAAVQTMYGVRVNDPFEEGSGNDLPNKATKVDSAVPLIANLINQQDKDFYKAL